jgi:hemerythrin-like domain-containing protein
MTAVMSPVSGADEAVDMTTRPSPTQAAGPFARLRAEHRRALDALRTFERAMGDASRGRPAARTARDTSGEPGASSACDESPFEALAAYLAGPFSAHLAVEECVLFPALMEHLPELELALEPLLEDHVTIREMSASLAELLARPGTPRRDEQLRVLGRDLTDLVRLHVRKEGRTVMDWCERVLPAAVRLGLGRRIARAVAAPPRPERRRA